MTSKQLILNYVAKGDKTRHPSISKASPKLSMMPGVKEGILTQLL